MKNHTALNCRFWDRPMFCYHEQEVITMAIRKGKPSRKSENVSRTNRRAHTKGKGRR